MRFREIRNPERRIENPTRYGIDILTGSINEKANQLVEKLNTESSDIFPDELGCIDGKIIMYYSIDAFNYAVVTKDDNEKYVLLRVDYKI